MTFAKDLEIELEGDEFEIVAMAFRDDHTAELVTIADLSFEACTVTSEACFAVGEHVRLHVRGQGWIEGQVQSISDRQAVVVFSTHCGV